MSLQATYKSLESNPGGNWRALKEENREKLLDFQQQISGIYLLRGQRRYQQIVIPKISSIPVKFPVYDDHWKETLELTAVINHTRPSAEKRLDKT